MTFKYKRQTLLTPNVGEILALKTPEFGYDVDEDGVMQFRQVGEIDDVAEVQRDAEATDMAFLSRQFARLSGEEATPTWTEEDVSELPDNLLDMFNLVTSCRTEFDSLSASTRAQFGNDFYKFLSAVSDGSAQSILFPKQGGKPDDVDAQGDQSVLESPQKDDKGADVQPNAQL